MTLSIDQEAPPLRIDQDGTIRVGNGQVTLDTVIGAYELGESPERIAESYPTVTVVDAYGTIAYYLRHRRQLDAYLDERRKSADALQQRLEVTPGHQELRGRIIDRAREQGLE